MTPMPLHVAAQICFPHGGVTKSTLLAAIRAGSLTYAKVGNRYLVTEADIEGWMKQCRIQAKARDYGSESARGERPSISSGVSDRAKLAQASALLTAQALTKPSRTISPRTSGPTPANVISLPSPAQRS